MSAPYRRPRSKGFSLIEMLVVLAIIAVLTSLAIPSITSALDAQKLTAAARNVREALINARKKAIASNRVVEFRFRTDGGGSVYTTCEALADDQFGTNPTPVQKAQRLPTGLIFVNDSRSTLITGLTPQTETLSTGGTASYVAFQFQPDGSTANLPAGNVYITIARQTTAATSSNVASLRIDPLTGEVATYRP